MGASLQLLPAFAFTVAVLAMGVMMVITAFSVAGMVIAAVLGRGGVELRSFSGNQDRGWSLLTPPERLSRKVVPALLASDGELDRRPLREHAVHASSTNLPTHRSILAVDIEGFGRPERDDLIRGALRQSLYRVLTSALDQVGISSNHYETTDIGDALLVLVDPRVSKVRLLDLLIGQLAAQLAMQNRMASGAARLRLRVVVHAGELSRDVHGVYGEDLNTAFRLVNAQATRNHLAATTAPLVLIVSDPIYQSVIRHGYGGIDASNYRPVQIYEKETRTTAWIYLVPVADVG
jgi:hypothetical protein